MIYIDQNLLNHRLKTGKYQRKKGDTFLVQHLNFIFNGMLHGSSGRVKTISEG